MRFLLEVIACSLEDARAAEAGGADRLELCSRLDLQGLTPLPEFVAEVVDAVHLPVRVMIRNNEGFRVSERELDQLERQVEALAPVPIEGIIAGFHDADGRLDFRAIDRLLRGAPGHWKLTLHRAFDFAAGSAEARLEAVLTHGRADLVLTSNPVTSRPGTPTVASGTGPAGGPSAQPGVEFLLGGGVTDENLLPLLRQYACRQVHIGRAARWPPETTAPVAPWRVRAFRDVLNRNCRPGC